MLVPQQGSIPFYRRSPKEIFEIKHTSSFYTMYVFFSSQKSNLISDSLIKGNAMVCWSNFRCILYTWHRCGPPFVLLQLSLVIVITVDFVEKKHCCGFLLSFIKNLNIILYININIGIFFKAILGIKSNI